MSPGEIESTTVANAIAIEKLTGVAERTSRDVDRVVKHLDEMLPLKSDILTLKADIIDLKQSRTRWAWSIITVLGSTIGTLIYVIEDLIKLGIIGPN